MDYVQRLNPIADDPESLEAAYRQSLEEKRSDDFRAALERLYAGQPENRLLAAWHFRFAFENLPAAARKPANWILVILLSITTGLVFWSISDESLTLLGNIPVIFQVWGPVAVLGIMAYFAVEDAPLRGRALALAGGLAGTLGYGYFTARSGFPFARQYADLLLLYIPALSWTALAVTLLGFRPDAQSRFAFVRKSLEIFVTGGLFLGAGLIFGVITIGLFSSLDITLPEVWIRLIAAGGVGLIPLIAVVSVYEAGLPPGRQTFGQGVGKLVPLLTQLMIPLSVLVLLVFMAFIPFNFYAPFENREVLMVYNILLFGIMGLLVGATPVADGDLSPAALRWIRRGVIVLAVQTTLISLYALAAVITRTVDGGWTINRLTVIGWNGINIALLISIAFRLLRSPAGEWVAAAKRVFKFGTTVYVGWVLLGLLVYPLIF